jgi:hypothetical protein
VLLGLVGLLCYWVGQATPVERPAGPAEEKEKKRNQADGWLKRVLGPNIELGCQKNRK